MENVRVHRSRVALAAAGVRVVCRFASGRPMNGRRKTDATFLRPGTVKFTQADRTGRWSYLPEWQRAAVRLGVVSVLTLLVIVYLVAPLAALLIVGALVTGGMAYGGYLVYRAGRHLSVQRSVVRPLWRALSSKGIQTPGWLTIPGDYATNKSAEVTIRLPDDWPGDPESRKSLLGIVTRKIGGDWDPHWTDQGRPILRLTHAPVPPSVVMFPDVLKKIRELSEGQVLLGLGSRNESIVIDFNAETPHVALSIGTGGGKSATLCLLIVQLLAQGATIEGIDPKRVSLNPLRGLAGLTIHRDIEQQWDAISMIRAEMDRRYAQLDADENATFPRLVLVIEEANTFRYDSEDYWEETKPKGANKEPRVFRDLSSILNKGRQANVNVLTVFQEMDAKSAGGGRARSQYGLKVLGRFTPQAWKMLVDTYPRPKSSKVRGRMIVSDGGDHRLVQTAYALDGPSLCTEAREHAMTGRPAVAVPGRHVPLSQVSQDGSDLANAVRTVPEQSIGLRQAVESGVLSISLDAARKAAQRDDEFPAPASFSGREHLYYPTDLRRWQANRPRLVQMSESEATR